MENGFGSIEWRKRVQCRIWGREEGEIVLRLFEIIVVCHIVLHLSKIIHTAHKSMCTFIKLFHAECCDNSSLLFHRLTKISSLDKKKTSFKLSVRRV